MLCDYQPHPLRFVWAFLVAGLIRTHTSLRGHLGGLQVLRLIFELAVADLFSFCVFVSAASSSLPSAASLVGAWLVSLIVAYPLRTIVAQRACNRRLAVFAHVLKSSPVSTGALLDRKSVV